MSTDNTAAIEQRLRELGLTIPAGVAAAANYVPFLRDGHHLYVSGQLPLAGGKPSLLGRVGEAVTVEQAYEAAKLCAVNIIAQIQAAGQLGRVRQILRIGGFVASTPTFTDHPKVINGASDLLVAVFGDAGRHARAAVGVSALPFGVPVEVEAIVALNSAD